MDMQAPKDCVVLQGYWTIYDNPQDGNGGDHLQIWRAAVNAFNKQS
jgi:hypothetical protein